MKVLYSTLLGFMAYMDQILCDVCPRVDRIDLTKAGNLCSESSSMVGMTCQSAWDTETVTRTVWHPGTSGEGASTTMYSQHRLVIHRVTVTQYQWESGYATKLLLNIGGDMKLMSAVNGDYNIAEWVPDQPVTTTTLQLYIQEVGPHSGNAFGGIQAIEVFGCLETELTKATEGEKVTEPNLVPSSKTQTTSSSSNEDLFNFDGTISSLSTLDAGGSGYMVYIIGGIVALLALGLVSAVVFYVLKARKRGFDVFSDSSPRISIRPQSEPGSSESDRIEIEEV